MTTPTTENPYGTIILTTPPFLEEAKHQLNQGWLFNIDMDALLSCAFACFENVPIAETVLQMLMASILSDFYDVKERREGEIQKNFVAIVVKHLVLNIEQYLKDYGLLQQEQFPYRYKTLLPDGSVVLERIR